MNERDERETPCPRCGAEAEWSFVDDEKATVEVMCSNCGRFDMSREEFDHASADNTGLTEPE